ISLAVPAAGWVGFVHPEITPPSNFHHLRDTTRVCLAGLSQQNGAPVIDEQGQPCWINGSVQPHDDLLAHAVQYAAVINSPLLEKLIQLNGYNPEGACGRPTWGWRSYIFTMDALASLGRFDAAIKLGECYLRDVPLSRETSRVVKTVGSLIHRMGRQNEAVEYLETWLAENPDAPAGQVCTDLIEWCEGAAPAQTIIDLATRGIRDLAEEQPSSSVGNLYYRRALARDRDLLARHDAGEAEPKETCSRIAITLLDYAMSQKLGVNPGLIGPIQQRETVLRDLAVRLGCDGIGEQSNGGQDPLIGTAIQQILEIVHQDSKTDAEKAEAIREVLGDLDEERASHVMNMLRDAAERDDVPLELRSRIANLLPLIKRTEH
ncbi:hypothetical protein, partial [Roseovarius sp. MBR-79]